MVFLLGQHNIMAKRDYEKSQWFTAINIVNRLETYKHLIETYMPKDIIIN